jgi:hypothetical protein
MPFASKKQQRWAFASKQPFAKRWAKATDQSALKDAGTDAGASAHGPGGLLATPGLSGGKKKRWGTTLKATQIAGNLYRGDNGKFQKGGASTGKPTAKPARTAAPQRGDVLPKVTPLKPAKGGKGGKGKAPPKVKPVDVRQAKRDAEHEADRAQRAEDRQTRLARQQQQDAARAKREADKLAKANEPKKGGGGGGGGKDKPSDDEKKQQALAKKQQTAAETAKQVGLAPHGVTALHAAAEGTGYQATDAADGAAFAKAANELIASGLITDTGDALEATDQGRRALSALERGDVRGYQAALQDAKARLGREGAAKQRSAAATANRDAAAAKRAAPTPAPTPTPAPAPKADRPIGQRRLTVFKDAQGNHRWLSRTTTAYQDRDGEIISTEALDRDSQRMMATKSFGPLRWWHVGTPDPLSDTAPWGVGLDIGDCDYSVLIGRTRVESGTFKSAALATQVERVADALEMSPGFFHPLDQPIARVFTDIRTFERSLVPTRFGRASNLFTGFTVKETRMDPNEMERRFKAAITELGLSPEQAQTLGGQLVATEKAAQAQGVAFKSESAADEITINGVVYTVKAAAPPMPPAAAPAVDAAMADETIKADDMPLDDGMDDELAEDTDVIGNLSQAEFETMLGTMLTNAVAPLVKALDMAGKMGGYVDELKSMMGGMATKDDSRSQELATLKSQLAQLTARIAQISGDQPALVLPDEVAAALKSAGPETPTQPGAVTIPDDPSRPFAGLAARTFPELYYTENGWQAKS